MIRKAVRVFISIEPDHARPGGEVTVTLEGPEAAGWIGGLYGALQTETSDGWATILHLTGLRGTGNGQFQPPIEPGRTRYELAVGIAGPLRFQVPHVPAGTYRLERKYGQPSRPEVVVLYGTLVVCD